MKKLITLFSSVFFITAFFAQVPPINHEQIKEDLFEILGDLSNNYVYLESKQVDLTCIKNHYLKQIEHIKTEEESVLFFEYLLDEFYDSHLILNTNRPSSYRLFSPIYITLENNTPIVSGIWQSQIDNLTEEILGAQLLQVNGSSIDSEIINFPTHCSNKNDSTVKEWIINKIIAGRYNQPRKLTLLLKNGNTTVIDLDQLNFKINKTLLNSEVKDNIAYIRINNSLGDNNLITIFDSTLNTLMQTKGLILDLRNTVGGGNSYVARAIMSRFIDTNMPYQKHSYEEQYDNGPSIERSWVEYVTPRGTSYSKPLIVLVGRWTGSMGEGLAIGVEGLKRGIVLGTEMERLAGEIDGFQFKNRNFGYRISTAKLSHLNGTPREKYIPANYFKQTTISKDETLMEAIKIIQTQY